MAARIELIDCHQGDFHVGVADALQRRFAHLLRAPRRAARAALRDAPAPLDRAGP
jgi:hypothetical protein